MNPKASYVCSREASLSLSRESESREARELVSLFSLYYERPPEREIVVLSLEELRQSRVTREPEGREVLTRRCTVRNAHREMSSGMSSPPLGPPLRPADVRTCYMRLLRYAARWGCTYALYCGGWLLGGGDERKGAILRTVAAVVFPAPIQYNQLQKIQDLFCKFTLEREYARSKW
jgi:hypothetical protein